MKAVDMAVWLAFFQVAIIIMNYTVATSISTGGNELAAFYNPATGYMYGTTNQMNASGLQSDTQAAATDLSGTQGSSQGLFGWFNAQFQGFFKALGPFLQILNGIVNGVSIMIQNFGGASMKGIGDAVQTCMWIIYGYAVFQIMSGRGGKEAN
jgi:hypothetical protein